MIDDNGEGKVKTKKKGKNSGGGGGGGFQSLGLSEPVYRGIVRLGFRVPTPVQRKSLPPILAGSDTVVMARTGSGKTAAFLIPVLEKLLASGRGGLTSSNSGGDIGTILANTNTNTNKSAGAIILSPTRELSLQTLRVLQKLSHFTSLKSIGINGGESMEKQFSLLSSHPDIIVATPGRLAHHLSEIPDLHLNDVEMCVFDEADRLFEMGFAPQIRQICATMPSSSSGGGGGGGTRQTLLFSATMPKILVEFTKTGLMDSDPVVVRLDSECTVSEELRIGFLVCRSTEKDAVLLHLIRDVLSSTREGGGKDDEGETNKKNQKQQHHNGRRSGGQGGDTTNKSTITTGLTLIFAATRHHVEYVTTLLNCSGLNATMIYGTMDQEARKMNLASFRSGKTPILVVTDVASRGIDIPLIDHVVHYAFPPSAKLFVHRSGRAARAGRVGYAWGLVDPEEMPYMVDLYVFLGRKLSTGSDHEETGGDKEQQEKNEHNQMEYTHYSLQNMTPEMVHYGTVPELVLTEEVENVRRIIDSELTSSQDAEALRSLKKVCENAMKQYRRSRPEASKEGVRRAKAILEGEKMDSGARNGGFLPCHPLLRDVERRRLSSQANADVTADGDGAKEAIIKNRMENLKKREEFLRAMANFRPKETIFEAFSTGGVKEAHVVSQVDKGRTTAGSKKVDSSAALAAMKNMRRQMKLARDKGHALVVAGTRNAQIMNGDIDPDKDEYEKEESRNVCAELDYVDEREVVDICAVDEKDPARTNPGAPSAATTPVPPSEIREGKRRLSKAERRRLKKGGDFTSAHPLGQQHDKTKKTKEMRGSDFRDPNHFISDDLTGVLGDPQSAEAAARSRQIEAAMQPSSAHSQKSAVRLEETMLDILGDEHMDLVQKQRMMRWDKSKRKYVQTTVGAELSGDSKSKRMRVESGQLVKSDKMKLGELYDKWQKKTNRSVGRVGVFDDVNEESENDVLLDKAAGGRGSRKSPAGGSDKQQNKGGDDRRSASQIRKERERRRDMKIKNMKKEDRRKFERIERNKRLQKNVEMATKVKGWQGKKGKSGRWVGKK